jgi:DNA-binding transcriptional LysR family regulator
MIIRKLEYLIALAREGHFARAAAACHVSQPTLSAALRQLESEMGVTILKRGQRYSGLTDRGERVLAFAQRMAVECERLRADLERRGGDALGKIRLGVVASAIPVASELTSLFQKEHPQVMVTIEGLTPADIQRAFQDSKIDVAITYLEDAVRREGRNHSLYTEKYSFLFQGNKGGLDTRKSITWDEASQMPLCLLAPEMQSTSSPIRDLLNLPGPSVAHMETNSLTVLYANVRSGPWASILPASLAEGPQIGSDLRSIPLLPSGTSISVGLMIPDRDLTFPLAEAFFNMGVSMKRAHVQRRRAPAAP